MIAGRQLKICGITSAADAEAAVRHGADHLGFIFHPASPRRLAAEAYRTLAPKLPAAKKVAVSVEPTAEALEAALAAGFDRFQIHFRHDLPIERVAAWSRQVGPERLWLAPRLPAGVEVAPAWLPLAATFLLDTFDPELAGGTGRAGDWAKFARHLAAHPGKTWILSGGLSPENAAAALAASGARFLDANSGVEASPGKKDRAKLAALEAILRQG